MLGDFLVHQTFVGFLPEMNFSLAKVAIKLSLPARKAFKTGHVRAQNLQETHVVKNTLGQETGKSVSLSCNFVSKPRFLLDRVVKSWTNENESSVFLGPKSGMTDRRAEKVLIFV